jgi:AraC-like DNA-binding protein
MSPGQPFGRLARWPGACDVKERWPKRAQLVCEAGGQRDSACPRRANGAGEPPALCDHVVDWYLVPLAEARASADHDRSRSQMTMVGAGPPTAFTYIRCAPTGLPERVFAECAPPREPARSLRLLLGLITSAADRIRLSEAVCRDFRLVSAHTVRAFRELVMRNPAAVSGMLLEPVDASGMSTVPLLAELRKTFPQTPLLAYCQPVQRASQVLVGLARAGVDDLVFRSLAEDGAALRAALAAAEQATTVRRVIDRLRDAVDPVVHDLIDYAVAHAAQPIRLDRVAAALGVHRRTLANRCRRVGLPPPAQVLTWCRLAVVGTLLEQPACTIQYVAGALGFSSGAVLRNVIRRYLAVTGTELRARGGLEFVASVFLRPTDASGSREVATNKALPD